MMDIISYKKLLKPCVAILTCLYISTAIAATPIQADPMFAAVPADEAQDIAIETYVYAYPMVLMEITRRVMTNIAQPDSNIGHAPMNQIANVKHLVDAKSTDVVKPNADTLYSTMWFDVTNEPLVVEVADSKGRYYLLELLDMWTDVFDSPGTRTTGNGKQTFVIANTDWQGTIPNDSFLIRSPTNIGWFIGRTEVNGESDYADVWKFQDQLKVTPLSKYGSAYVAANGPVNSSQDMHAPVDQVEKLSANEFFSMFCDILQNNEPHINDNPILHRMARIGLKPGQKFNVTDPAVLQALNAAPKIGLERIKATKATSGVYANGWRTSLTAIGTYGTDYLHRSGLAYYGLGANTVEDAVYPMAFTDFNGKPFISSKKYKMHFSKEQLPPVKGFWSLTMYNDRQLFVDNKINRYALGGNSNLKFNTDGSLDIFIQRNSPGKDRESNWLPAPESGNFTLTMRLYWPDFSVIDQSWTPPKVTEQK